MQVEFRMGDYKLQIDEVSRALSLTRQSVQLLGDLMRKRHQGNFCRSGEAELLEDALNVSQANPVRIIDISDLVAPDLQRDGAPGLSVVRKLDVEGPHHIFGRHVLGACRIAWHDAPREAPHPLDNAALSRSA